MFVKFNNLTDFKISCLLIYKDAFHIFVCNFNYVSILLSILNMFFIYNFIKIILISMLYHLLVYFMVIISTAYFHREELTCLGSFGGFQYGSAGKESSCKAGDLGSISGLGRSPEENSNPLQYSCLENLHGERGLVGYSPWGQKELDTTE